MKFLKTQYVSIPETARINARSKQKTDPTNYKKTIIQNYLWDLSDWNCTRTQNHLVWPNLAKWLSVRLRTKWFWVRVQLQSLKLQISRLLRARRSLTFRQLLSVDSLWNPYVTWQEHTVICGIILTSPSISKSALYSSNSSIISKLPLAAALWTALLPSCARMKLKLFKNSYWNLLATNPTCTITTYYPIMENQCWYSGENFPFWNSNLDNFTFFNQL